MRSRAVSLPLRCCEAMRFSYFYILELYFYLKFDNEAILTIISPWFGGDPGDAWQGLL